MEQLLTNEQQIDELNSRVKTYLAPSKIHGVGVFALRDIAKGQKLYADFTPTVYSLTYSHFSKLFPEVRKHLIERWPRIVIGSRFAYPTDRVQAYMNCGEGADANYDAVNDIILRDVLKDTEILHDYKLIEGWQTAYPWLIKKKNEDAKK